MESSREFRAMEGINTMLEAALEYRFKYNWSVIPLAPRSKVPPKDFQVIQYRERLATEDEIRQWWKEDPNYNIGIVTGKLSNLFVIDIDKYKPEYSEETVMRYIPDSIQTAIDKSPRGGEHLYFQYPKDCDPTIHSDTLPAVDYRGEGGYILAPPSKFQGLSSSWVINPSEISLPAPPPLFISLLSSINKDNTNYIYRENSKSQIPSDKLSSLSTLSTNVFTVGRRDQDMFHLANILVKGGCETDFMNEIMMMAALSCNPPFPENEVKTKIMSAIQRAERRERNLTHEISEWVLSSSGVFLSSEVAKCLHLSSREDQKNLSTVLRRLSQGENRIIEKVGNKNGSFRLLENNADTIDVLSADTTPFNIKLPLGVHEYVTVHKGNVIIIAGESNAGKTAYCLNIARINKQSHHVNYLSNEMQDGTELRIRLEEFPEPLESWKAVNFRYRCDNFPDVIKPDDVNIIDYLDEGGDGEAYKMTSRIRAISAKLNKGIAVICIQKSSGKSFGFGGEGTLNTARLYLTIARTGVLTIEKGKIWRQKSVNPNKMSIKFKLVSGCNFIKDGEWIKGN
jgi:hypothetical protein